MSTTRPGGTMSPTRPNRGTPPSSVKRDRESVESAPHRRRHDSIDLALIVGLAAIVFSAIYFISDLIEVAQGNFSTLRLCLPMSVKLRFPCS